MIGVKFEFSLLTSISDGPFGPLTIIYTVFSPHSLHFARKSFIVVSEVTKPAGQTQDWPINKNDYIRTSENCLPVSSSWIAFSPQG